MASSKYTKPSDAQLRERLTPLEFEVTQNDATEPPFRNTFWNNHSAGIYVDVATGEPLFSSLDKFDSGTGWPSFVRPIEDGHVVSKTDNKYGMRRTEVRSAAGDSHLGHVFDDGPRPTGLRYCINSASLRFVPVDRLEAEGYGGFAAAFGGARAPLPASHDNACAVPPPGEKASCEATIETAVFSGRARAATTLGDLPGVIEVTTGQNDRTDAVQVLFDPTRVAYSELLERWGALIPAEDERPARTVFFTSDEQRKVALAWRSRAAQNPNLGEVIIKPTDAGAFQGA